MKNRLEEYSATGPIREHVEAAAKESTATANRLLKGFTDCVVEHPKTSLVAMATLGVLVGWFLKRR